MTLSPKQQDYIRKHRGEKSPEALAKHLKLSADAVEAFCRELDREKPAELDPRTKRLLTILTPLIPILFFLLLEGGLQVFDYGGNLDLFISAPDEYAEYYMCNPRVTRRYFFMQASTPTPPNDIFRKKKADNAYRIFVLGGSTTAGYPYEHNLMFSRILAKRLQDAFPEREIEVVNVATAAINSYTVLDFTDEVLDQQPDALLIYAGHNEFYGALGAASLENLGRYRWFTKTYLELKGFKTFLLMRDAIGWLRKKMTEMTQGSSPYDPSATLMERLVVEQQIPLGSETYLAGRAQFEGNLRDIFALAKEAGVPVLISELVSNVRDMAPFISVPGEEQPEARTVFLEAREKEETGDFDAAREAYYLAKDLDALRFRATEEFNGLIHGIAGEFNSPVVPMKRYFQEASPNGLLGNNLMLEHLHPNISGYFLMAEAFFQSMREQSMISPNWPVGRLSNSADYQRNWGKTAVDSLYGDLRIRILKGGWPFKPKSEPNRALLDYRPTTLAESLAVRVWQDDTFNLERAHVELANHYEKKRDYDAAFEEYKALMALTPYNSSPFLRGADMLIKGQRFNQALPVLRESLKREESAFANKWIGTILLNNNRIQQSLPFLEKAVKMAGDDPQLLYNLSGAYALDQQFEKALETLNLLFRVDPNFPEAALLKRQVEQVLMEQRTPGQ
ncbi:MAG: tetratricopeptide repeat protein [Calditrichaeota bacterium]|nr:tetratricopeptide repeat protein [Calditrichota bacterium]